jgi:glycosyltransferase involved in cell wall biosynthesis
MGSQPLISVCIPAYNNEKFIAQTLESVLAQTYGHFEIILTDDHSKDATVATVKRYNDPRIRLIQNATNLGMIGNFNFAMSQATGKYLKLLCGDDIIYPDCLQRQVEVLEAPSNSRVVLAVCVSDVINARSEVVLRRQPRLGTGRIAGANLVRNCVRWGTNFIGEPGAGLFRKTAFDGPSPFDPANPYLIDMDLWVQLLKRGDAFIDKTPLAGFRITTDSASKKLGLKQASYFRRFARKMYASHNYGVTRLDVLAGCALSLLWCLLRNWYINSQARKK